MLWFRAARSPTRRRQPAAGDAIDESFAHARAASTVVESIPLVTRNLEPSFSVSYTPARKTPLRRNSRLSRTGTPACSRPPETLAAPAEKVDITSELEELFDSTDTDDPEAAGRREDARCTVAR